MKPKAQLEFLMGEQKGSEFQISDATIHIGRAGDNDLVLDDNLVSRHHAHITLEEDSYYMIDLDTANGTYVNKKRIHNQKLSSGDIIQIGNQIFRFVLPHAEHQKVVPISSKGAPQRETISKTPKRVTKRSPIRTILYATAGLFALLFIWILTLPSPDKETKEVKAKEERDLPIFEDLPRLEREEYAINREKAQQFYEEGYRELIEKNFERAIDAFNTALELYPDHRLARLYLKRAEETISEEINNHYKAGINYFNSGQYSLSIFHFKTVLRLLSRRRPAQDYCDIREERAPELKNPDFEKYCDAKKRILEAQERRTSQ